MASKQKAAKKNRKPLAQGRLVSDTIRQQPKTVVGGVEEDADNEISFKVHVASPRSRLQSRIVHHDGGKRLTVDSAGHNEWISPAVPPRPTIPTTLDVSYSEEESEQAEWSMAELKASNRSENVLVVDALRQSFDPNRSEVDIVMGYTRSPAKVFCHSPGRKVRSETRSRRVLVGGVPSLSILTEDSHTVHKDNENMDSSKTQPVVTMNAPPGRVASPAGLPVPLLPLGRPTHYPQPNFDDSLKSMSPNHDFEKTDYDDQMSVISTTSSLGEVLGMSNTVNSSTKSEGSKKKKNIVVPSRYLQSSSKFTPSASLLKKSAPMPAPQSKGNSSRLKGSSKKKSSNPKKSVSLQQTPMADRAQPTPVTDRVQPTPIAQQGIKGAGKTSTPTHDDASFMHNIDTSAIAPANISTMTSLLSNGDVSITAPVKKLTSDKSKRKTQLELDMEYCEYVQWLYLSTSLDKSFREQENNAMAQMTSLFTETEKLRKREHDLKREIQQMEHANKLDEQLDLQRSGLGPVIPKLKQLGEEHRVMAHALDTTRHQIATRGIHLPVDSDNFQEDLTSALNESEMLLGQISMITRQEHPKVAEYATICKALKDAVNDGGKVQGQCEELMAATEALTITETSLRIQAIQNPKENPMNTV